MIEICVDLPEDFLLEMKNIVISFIENGMIS